MIPVYNIPHMFRERAETVRDLAPGATAAAKVWELAAREVEHALRALEQETLNLQESAAESGYSAGHLGRLVREGVIPNAGRENAPRIRRSDLPIKAGGLRITGEDGETTLPKRQIARSIVDSKEVNDD